MGLTEYLCPISGLRINSGTRVCVLLYSPGMRQEPGLSLRAPYFWATFTGYVGESQWKVEPGSIDEVILRSWCRLLLRDANRDSRVRMVRWLNASRAKNAETVNAGDGDMVAEGAAIPTDGMARPILIPIEGEPAEGEAPIERRHPSDGTLSMVPERIGGESPTEVRVEEVAAGEGVAGATVQQDGAGVAGGHDPVTVPYVRDEVWDSLYEADPHQMERLVLHFLLDWNTDKICLGRQERIMPPPPKGLDSLDEKTRRDRLALYNDLLYSRRWLRRAYSKDAFSPLVVMVHEKAWDGLIGLRAGDVYSDGSPKVRIDLIREWSRFEIPQHEPLSTDRCHIHLINSWYPGLYTEELQNRFDTGQWMWYFLKRIGWIPGMVIGYADVKANLQYRQAMLRVAEQMPCHRCHCDVGTCQCE